MLTNNFRPLIDFYGYSTFKNVLGDTVNKQNFICGNAYQGSTPNNTGRNGESSNSRYDYNTTIETNNCAQETEAYSWAKIVDISTGSTDTSTNSSMGARKNGFVLFVGDDDTPATVNDYKLGNALNLDVISASCTHTNNYLTLVQRTFQNNTADSVVVKEVGCYVFAQNPTSTVSKHFPIIMIGHKILDTPVTIEVGDTYTFTYKINMSGITFTEADEE